MKKSDVLALLEEMPEEFEVDDLMYELYVQTAIEEGDRDLEAGRILSHEEVLKLVQSWRS